jgi:hypothetical protein
MEPKVTNNWIDRYNDDEMDEFERDLFREKLKTNRLLRQEQKLDVRLNEFLADTEKIEFMARISNLAEKSRKCTKKKGVLEIAAIYFMMAGILFVIFHLNRPPGHQDISRAVPEMGFYAQTIHQPEEKNMVLSEEGKYRRVRSATRDLQTDQMDVYRKFPEYELLVGSVYRHGGLVMTSPEPSSSIGIEDSVVFRWEPVLTDNYNELTIRFTDNTGRQIRDSTIKISALRYSLSAKSLGTGLFYWKVLVDEELTSIGKVSIR